MQLNVLNDLAEAMKALDGKKNSSPRKPRFVLVPIRFASKAWPRSGLAEPRSASIAGWKHGNSFINGTERKDCHDQDKQVKGLVLGSFFGT